LREAALPIIEADRHAKKELKKAVRGDRAEGRGPDRRGGADRAGLLCGGAQRPDRRRPATARGLRLHDRLEAIEASLGRIEEKGGVQERS
jgi:hypothetical protein